MINKNYLFKHGTESVVQNQSGAEAEFPKTGAGSGPELDRFEDGFAHVKFSISMSRALEQRVIEAAQEQSRTRSGFIADALVSYLSGNRKQTWPPKESPVDWSYLLRRMEALEDRFQALENSQPNREYILAQIRDLTGKVDHQGYKIDNIDLRLCKLWDQVNDK